MVKEPLPGGDNDRFAKIFERLAKLPAGHKPRAGDFASAVWEFGREALVKLEEQKRTEIVFSDKYHKLSWSKEHPILRAVYERYRECWAVMGLSFYEMVLMHLPRNDSPSGIVDSNVTFVACNVFCPHHLRRWSETVFGRNRAFVRCGAEKARNQAAGWSHQNPSDR